MPYLINTDNSLTLMIHCETFKYEVPHDESPSHTHMLRTETITTKFLILIKTTLTITSKSLIKTILTQRVYVLLACWPVDSMVMGSFLPSKWISKISLDSHGQSKIIGYQKRL